MADLFKHNVKLTPVVAQNGTMGQDLFTDYRLIRGMETEFTIDVPCQLNVFGRIDVNHTGNYYQGNTMAAFKLFLNGTYIENSACGGNIVDLTQHYLSVPVWASEVLQPGTYTLQMQGRAATTGAPGVDGILEVKQWMSGMAVQVIPLSI